MPVGRTKADSFLTCFVRASALWAGITGALILLPSELASQSPQNGFPFHSPSPAGYNVILLQPWHTEVSILGLVECPEIEGVQKMSEGMKSFVISSNGVPVKLYPREFSFRVTATLRKTLLDGPSTTVTTKYEPYKFLTKLGFRLKIYHGLDRREIFPTSVKMIGVPADVPYDERIFRVNFDVEDLPVSDRIVIEILSPDNEVLTHFTFGLL